MGIALVVIGATAFIGWLYFGTAVSPLMLINDPAELSGLPSYTGAYSNFGVLLWCASATMWLFAAMLLRHHPDMTMWVRAFAALGAFTTVLGLDDLFQLHEEAGRGLATLVGLSDSYGVPQLLEGAIFASYAIVGALVGRRHWPVIRQTEILLAAVGIGAMGASVAIDLSIHIVTVGDDMANVTDGLEELAKLGGILAWAVYSARTAHDAVATRLKTATHQP